MLILGGEVDVEMGRPPSDEMKREKETFFERDLARVDRLKPGEENLLRRLHKMRIRGRAFDVADRSIVGIGGDEDMIVAVGYRVKSKRGTQFRIWATQTLKNYLAKGCALDVERMNNLDCHPLSKNRLF